MSESTNSHSQKILLENMVSELINNLYQRCITERKRRETISAVTTALTKLGIHTHEIEIHEEDVIYALTYPSDSVSEKFREIIRYVIGGVPWCSPSIIAMVEEPRGKKKKLEILGEVIIEETKNETVIYKKITEVDVDGKKVGIYLVACTIME